MIAPSDQTLLARYKQGNPLAFRELVDRHAGSVFNLARRLLLDPMQAETITQETFLRLIPSLGQLRSDAPFKPFLFRIAVHLCHDVARKKHPELFTDDDARALANEPKENESITDKPPLRWEQFKAEELEQRVRAAVESLAIPYQTAILLRYTEDFSYEEIGEILSIPLNTVRTHLRRARTQLRVILEKDAGSRDL